MKQQRMYRCKFCNTPVQGHKTCAACKTKTAQPDKAKIKEVMHEFKEGTLKSGKSKKKVTKRKQAVAIALSEARKKTKKSNKVK